MTAPPGTMLNCVAPAAVNSRTQTCQRVVDLIHGALARAIPERVIAACNGACVSSTFSGVDPRTGQFYVYLETIGGGSGARATKDGLDGVHVHITNTSNLPVEALETAYPLMVERYALVPDSGGSYFIARLLGAPRAFEWMTQNRKLTAEEALGWGLVSEVVADDQLPARAAELAANYAQAPTRGVGMTKRLFDNAQAASLDEQLELEAQLQSAATQTDDFREGVTAFLEKRPPQFTGS